MNDVDDDQNKDIGEGIKDKRVSHAGAGATVFALVALIATIATEVIEQVLPEGIGHLSSIIGLETAVVARSEEATQAHAGGARVANILFAGLTGAFTGDYDRREALALDVSIVTEGDGVGSAANLGLEVDTHLVVLLLDQPPGVFLLLPGHISLLLLSGGGFGAMESPGCALPLGAGIPVTDLRTTNFTQGLVNPLLHIGLDDVVRIGGSCVAIRPGVAHILIVVPFITFPILTRLLVHLHGHLISGPILGLLDPLISVFLKGLEPPLIIATYVGRVMLDEAIIGIGGCSKLTRTPTPVNEGAGGVEMCEGVLVDLTLISPLHLGLDLLHIIPILKKALHLVPTTISGRPLVVHAFPISGADSRLSLLLVHVVLVGEPSRLIPVGLAVACLGVDTGLGSSQATHHATRISHLGEGSLNDLGVGTPAAALVDPGLGRANFLSVAEALTHIAASTC